jgi:hypothetical protein
MAPESVRSNRHPGLGQPQLREITGEAITQIELKAGGLRDGYVKFPDGAGRGCGMRP